MNNRFTLAVLPRTQRGSGLVLDAHPDGSKFIYCHGHSVVIREFDSPQYADVYTQHATDVTCARYSPSGFYIASADKSGKIRIWDTVNAEHILKNEFQPISGPIKDLAWSPDNQRIVCVGDGREKFGHVFLADTGTSNGDITGQSRPVNSCDFRPARPFRIITGSEDNTAAFYEGPPFKFKGTKTDHSRYVQVVRYSPDGKVWASGGFDGKMFLYEGKDSELIGEFKDGDNNAHSGGVYGLSFSPKGDKVLSASGDKTCKIFDVETRTCVATYTTGSDIMDQQLGCLWSKNHLISVSLSGNIHFLDERTPGSVTMTVYGHNKPITALARGGDEERCKTLFTGDSEGRVIAWQTEQGIGARLRGPGPTNQVNGLAAEPDGSVVSVGIDDTLRRASADGEFTSLAAKLGAQPRAVRFCGEGAGAATAVATVKSLLLLDGDGNVLRERSLPFEPSSLAYCEQSRHLAVGDSSEAGAILVVSADDLENEIKTSKATGAVTSLAFSPDGRYLAAGDANRRVVLLDASAYEKAHAKEWGFHSARVTCVAWSPDSKFLASGGLDCAVILWSVDQPAKHHVLLGAHVQSQITGVAWMDPVTVASTGQDGNVKIWNVTWKV